MVQTKPDAACNSPSSVAFAVTYKPHCQSVADKLTVPVENILGLAAEESTWGTSDAALNLNNYFGMEKAAKGNSPARIKFATDMVVAKKTIDAKVHVYLAKYSSFNDGAESFAYYFGDAVRGLSTPLNFANALIKAGFNTGDSRTGGRDGFAEYLAGIIDMARRRMNCKT